MHTLDLPNPEAGAKSNYKDQNVLLFICGKEAATALHTGENNALLHPEYSSETGNVLKLNHPYPFAPASSHSWPQSGEGSKLGVQAATTVGEEVLAVGPFQDCTCGFQL